MDDEDIYGADIYGTTSYDSSGAAAGGFGGGGYREAAVVDNRQQEIDALNTKLVEKDARIASLEGELKKAQTSAEDWRSAFREAANATLDTKSSGDPGAAVAEMRKMRSTDKPTPDKHLTVGPEDTSGSRQREAALQMQLAERNLENIELRRLANAARQCSDSNIAEVRQLLLDPAVAREFERMRGDLEAKAKEVKGLQEELQAVGFSQDSKAGRMLMAKCRALQDENEEMGRELAEGKVHALERQVALSKVFTEDMRARYLELEDHAHVLDAENEDLMQQVFVLKKQLREAESRSLAREQSSGRERERARGTAPPGLPPKFGAPNSQGAYILGSQRSLPKPPPGHPGMGGSSGSGGMGNSYGGGHGIGSPDSDRKRGPPGMDRFGGGKRTR